MTSLDRRSRKKQETREKILQAARDILIADGYGALTLRQVAERIEYTPGAIYKYFADKQSLVQELCRNDYFDFFQKLKNTKKSEDPLEQLKALAQTYLNFALHFPNQFRLLFLSRPPIDRSEIAKRGNPDQDIYVTLMTVVRLALQKGRFTRYADRPEFVAQTLFSAVHGAVAWVIALADSPLMPEIDANKHMSEMLDVMFLGFDQ